MENSLRLRVPPLAVTLLWTVFMWGLHRADGEAFDLRFRGQRWAAAALLAAALAVAAAGVYTFRKARTTVDPTRPDRTARLVTGSVYRFTRNPMYLGMALALLAWGVHLGSLLALLFMLLFMVYMTRFQIVPEEQALMQKFGGAYQRYRKQVRRWL